MKSFALEAIDTFFLKDGTPFDAGSVAKDGVGGLFPPTPETVVGAIRARLARAKGWSGRGAWDPKLHAILGDGPENLGALSFTGPLLERGDKVYFPAPRHLFLEGNEPRALTRPGAPVACDLGPQVRLPELPGTGDVNTRWKPAADLFIDASGLEAILRGEMPSKSSLSLGAIDPAGPSSVGEGLWVEDFRIGIGRNSATRSVEDGRLYATRHIRPHSGVAVTGCVHGLPDDWPNWRSGLLPLGGEHRAAALGESTALTSFLNRDRPWPVGNSFVLLALTPIDLEQPADWLRPMAEWPGSARFLSACMDRMVKLGGWNTLTREPTPLRPMIPAGSALFFEGHAEAFARALPESRHGLVRIGRRMRHGYGLAAIGALSAH